MPWFEFCNYLAGLGSDTPLGRVVHIRTETNKDIIASWPERAQRQNAEWRFKQHLKFAQSLTHEEIMAGAAEQEAFFRSMMKKSK